MNWKDNEWNPDHSHTVGLFSLMVWALLSHHSEAHSSCGAPVRRAQMIQAPSLQTASFSPFFSSLSLSLSLLGTFQSAPPVHPLLPLPSPESGRPRRHHSPLGDNWHKGGLGGPGCSRSRCTATGEWAEESPPPPQMMKTLSVRIRKERCALAEGITAIKAVPPHLRMSIPLSTYSLFVTLNQFWDSKAFHAAFTLPNCCKASFFFMWS